MLGSASPDAVPLLHSLALGCLVGLLLRAHAARVHIVRSTPQGRQSAAYRERSAANLTIALDRGSYERRERRLPTCTNLEVEYAFNASIPISEAKCYGDGSREHVRVRAYSDYGVWLS